MWMWMVEDVTCHMSHALSCEYRVKSAGFLYLKVCVIKTSWHFVLRDVSHMWLALDFGLSDFSTFWGFGVFGLRDFLGIGYIAGVLEYFVCGMCMGKVLFWRKLGGLDFVFSSKSFLLLFVTINLTINHIFFPWFVQVFSYNNTKFNNQPNSLHL